MMQSKDYIQLASGTITAHRMRSALTALGIAIGIAAVILLTSIGEGIHRFVLHEFTQFGTNIIGINPGRATTHGVSVGVFGSVRPLTLDDAAALNRVPHIRAVVPVVQGNVEVEFKQFGRRTTIYGVGPDFTDAFKFNVSAGRFLPRDDPHAPRAFAVLGSKLRHELFGQQSPLGQRIRVGGHRYRIIGTMEPKGQVLGFDLDDTVYIPAARALELLNLDGLMEIDVLYAENAVLEEVVKGIRRTLIARHGRDDFTITTQQQMLDVLGSILDILTFAVAAVGAISLLVGAIGILTIMTISVTERTSEIGLLRALGASRRQILSLFLGEAAILSALGGILGLVIGLGLAALIHAFVPALPTHTPLSYVLLAEVLAIVVGLVAGIIPSQHAARLDPIEAIRAE